MKRLLAILTSLLTVLCGVAQAMPPPPQYSVVDLGTLGGPNVQVTGINSTGQVIGNADGAVAGTGYAFLWTAPGPMVSLGALGSLPTQSSASSINDSSWVVGASNGEGFVWTPKNGMQGVGFLSGGTYSILESINSSDVAVGGATPAGATVADAAIWDPTNGLRDLNSSIVNPPADWAPTVAILINQSGLISGIGDGGFSLTTGPINEHAFTLSGDSLTVIPSPGGDIQPAGMDASGEVVGVYNGKYTRAFAYTPALGTRDLGTLGGVWSGADALNDFGTIVGGSQLADGSGAAFLYTDSGGMVNLNTLVHLNGWTLGVATGINNDGQIICQGVNSDNVYHGFLLTPIPESPTLHLGIAASLIVFVFCRRRRFKCCTAAVWMRLGFRQNSFAWPITAPTATGGPHRDAREISGKGALHRRTLPCNASKNERFQVVFRKLNAPAAKVSGAAAPGGAGTCR